jgi:hypothetical protein
MPTATPIFLQTPQWAGTAYTTASSTATHVTGGSSGTRVSSLTAHSNSTSAHVFNVGISTGGASLPLAAVSIPASAGSDGVVPPVNLLSPTLIPGLPLDAQGVPYITLPSTSHNLTLTASAAINTGKQVTFHSMYGGF